MGCDGGSIPKRCEMVREQAKKEIKDKDMARKARWFNCAMTQQRLIEPIVSCRKGGLYNKEAVIEHILGINYNKLFCHIKKSKDYKTLNLTLNPIVMMKSSINNQSTTKELKGIIDSQSISSYICPVTGTEMNGYYKFGYFWKCGCVISERAYKEVVSSVCHKCGVTIDKNDFILLNDEENLNKIHSISSSKRSKINNTPVEKVGKKSLKKVISHNNTINNATTLSTTTTTTDNTSSVYKSLFTSSDEYQKNKHIATKNDRVMFSYF